MGFSKAGTRKPEHDPKESSLERLARLLPSGRGQGYALLVLLLKHLHDRTLAAGGE